MHFSTAKVIIDKNLQEIKMFHHTEPIHSGHILSKSKVQYSRGIQQEDKRKLWEQIYRLNIENEEI